MKRLLPLLNIAVLLFMLAACSSQTKEHWVASAPAENAYTAIDRDGVTIIPNGRLLTPMGNQYRVAPHPYGLLLSDDGSVAVTANSGVRPFSVSILENLLGGTPTIQQIPEGVETDEGILEAVFMGLALSPDNKTLYVGGGQEGKVILLDMASQNRIGAFDADVLFEGRDYEDSYIGDLALDGGGNILYAVDQTNFRVIAFDTQAKRVVASVPVGRYPFGITLTPDESRVYVANVGQFEYSVVDGYDPAAGKLGTSYPPFAYGTKEAEEGVTFEGYDVAGLGDPNALEAFSVWGIDVTDLSQPAVIAKIKTGFLVGEKIEDFPTIGGSSPNSLVSTNEHVYVTNGNNDAISVIDTRQDTVVANIALQIDERLGQLRGVIPFGLALSPDQNRLYVAEAGINAIGIIDLPTMSVLGHLPVGWFPSKVQVSPDGRQLVVANAKGFGSGPNGGPAFEVGPEGSYVGNLMNGYVSVLTIPADDQLEGETQRVVENNFSFKRAASSAFASRADNPIPVYPGEKESPIKHLVFIVKENRTYDEIFGQRTSGRGEPTLARFGAGVSVTSRDKSRSVEDVTIMPNHLSLADRFGISDNFYCDSDVSADGHRWLVGIYPNEWMETTVAASYGGGRDMKLNSTAPGMLSFVGSSGVIYPEDYNEAGSIWDHFDRFGVDFFNFGLGFEFAAASLEQEFKYTGARLPVNYPLPGPLYDRTSRRFATYNTNIPDQFRVDMFVEEFEARWAVEGLPEVLTIFLPNDHGSGERPDDGYPYFESYMADNDLALGRVIEYLSHTAYWKNMAIVVTEDDPQGGVDHIDAHRSVLMVMSPYVKKGHVSSVHYSFGSIMKTFWHVLGLPYLNQYDAGATDLADFFSSEPDFEPYRAIAPDDRIFNPQRALDPLDEDFKWESLSDVPALDDVNVMQAWAKAEDEKRLHKRDDE